MRSGRQGSWGILSPGLGLESVLSQLPPVLIHSLSFGLPRGSTASSLPPPSFLPALTPDLMVPFLLTHIPWLPVSLELIFSDLTVMTKVKLAE